MKPLWNHNKTCWTCFLKTRAPFREGGAGEDARATSRCGRRMHKDDATLLTQLDVKRVINKIITSERGRGPAAAGYGSGNYIHACAGLSANHQDNQ